MYTLYGAGLSIHILYLIYLYIISYIYTLHTVQASASPEAAEEAREVLRKAPLELSMSSKQASQHQQVTELLLNIKY